MSMRWRASFKNIVGMEEVLPIIIRIYAPARVVKKRWSNELVLADIDVLLLLERLRFGFEISGMYQALIS